MQFKNSKKKFIKVSLDFSNQALRHKHATGCEIFLQAITAAVYFN
jgi:hypothetical protein